MGILKDQYLKIFFGFDFYGAGNIGDDLMLGGFLSSIPQQFSGKLACIIPHSIASQEYRFPEIEWFSSAQIHYLDIIEEFDCWVGVGDTPFQMTSGDWFLDKLDEDSRIMQEKRKPMYMIGVGSEREVLSAKDTVSKITERMDRIWVRDQFTRDILVDHCNTSQEKVTIGADLANVVLREIFLNVDLSICPCHDLGIGYYSEYCNNSEINNLRNFIKHFGIEKSIVFFANETRENKNLEKGIYRSMFKGFASLFRKSPAVFYAPNYDNCTLKELVGHFQTYRVVMSSRYHALLTAAWAGCKVVALARSSKIEQLANELDIPLVKQPFSLEKLSNGYEEAKSVSRDKLNKMAEHAKLSVIDLFNCIMKDRTQHGEN